jgi:ADP-heptose:LPS heptosyltransferase
VAEAGVPSSADLSGLLDLAELAALLSRSRLLVCGDTGVGHLATACGTPSVLLFGPVPPTRWGPVVHPERHRVIWHGPARTGPAGARSGGADPLLLDITVAEALDAALDQLTATRPPA